MSIVGMGVRLCNTYSLSVLALRLPLKVCSLVSLEIGVLILFETSQDGMAKVPL